MRVRILDHPYAVPYVIEDEDGAPGDGPDLGADRQPTAQPFVVSGLAHQDGHGLQPHACALNDYVKSPRGRRGRRSPPPTRSAPPRAENLAVSLDDNRTPDPDLVRRLRRAGRRDARGHRPGRRRTRRTSARPTSRSRCRSGPKVPLLRCPATEVTVLAGGLDRVIDIPTYCHAWLPVGMTFDDVQFETGWQTEADATLSSDGPGGRRVTLHADAGARSSARPARGAHRGPGPAGDDRRERGRRERRGDATATGAAAAAAAAADLGQRARGGPVAHPRRRGLPRLARSPPRSARSPPRPSSRAAGSPSARSGCRLTLAVGTQPSPTASVAIEVSDGPGPQRAAAGCR